MEAAVMIGSVENMLKLLTSGIAETFENHGFTQKKDRFFEKADNKGRIRRYSMGLSKQKGWFSLHLTLQLLDPTLMVHVNTVLEKALRDDKFEYPESWSKSIIEKSIKTRTSNQVVAELTDWRMLKESSESLQHFNERFSIWLYSFETPDEKPGWKEQLLTSVELALKWFDEVDSNEWIRSNTVYPALYLLATEGLKQRVEEHYKAALKSLEDPHEVELFYRYLV
jgi:hypothetical protein